MLERPAVRGVTVVDGGRRRVLRRESVVDRQDVDSGVAAHQPAQPVVGVEVADDEAAAVEEDQQGL